MARKARKEQQFGVFSACLRGLLAHFLEEPSRHINTLHDLMDNAPEIEEAMSLKPLALLSKLRDMYLCRYDLQKLDAAAAQSERKSQGGAIQPQSQRGHVMEALPLPKQLSRAASCSKEAIAYPKLNKTMSKTRGKKGTSIRGTLARHRHDISNSKGHRKSAKTAPRPQTAAGGACSACTMRKTLSFRAILRQEFAAKAVTLEQALVMSHKWQHMKLAKNQATAGIGARGGRAPRDCAHSVAT